MTDAKPGAAPGSAPQLPVTTGVDDVHVHAPHTGHRWVDMAIALSAISISVISLFVAIGHGKTEERLVAANSWPFLVYDTDAIGLDSGQKVIRLMLENSGVGPARVQSVTVSLDGKVVRSREALMHDCCGVTARTAEQEFAAGLHSESAMVGVLPARDAVTFLSWRATDGNEAVMQRLNAARTRLRFSACYCSVLDECWRSDLTSTSTPRPVDSCPIGGDSYTE